MNKERRDTPSHSGPDEAYLDVLEKRIDAHNANHEAMQKMMAEVNDAARRLLDQGPPRETCPGCFMAIYDGARRQGWCCDCYPKRHLTEKEAYGY